MWGGKDTTVQSSFFFPSPRPSLSFSRCLGASAPKNPSLCWIEVLSRADRAIRMEACEPLASRHASHSHGSMRAIRMEACEPFAWRHASLSHGGMRASRLRLCFTWIFVYDFTYFFKRSSASRILSPNHYRDRPGGEVFRHTGDDLAGFVD